MSTREELQKLIDDVGCELKTIKENIEREKKSIETIEDELRRVYEYALVVLLGQHKEEKKKLEGERDVVQKRKDNFETSALLTTSKFYCELESYQVPFLILTIVGTKKPHQTLITMASEDYYQKMINDGHAKIDNLQTEIGEKEKKISKLEVEQNKKHTSSRLQEICELKEQSEKLNGNIAAETKRISNWADAIQKLKRKQEKGKK
ncbi:hypothetical protein F4821DRAFT_264213 [Hypoxylon rubiginosum]|uniref:Uncharacterized protein n=1 Tax=Hypoxylon rubiginosum TaxID=110542 RepID=A0ACC0CPC7_9PEZI|nr:hypothetical protein F4821DRAFT_264213 [Hypoxylon rubiginosum]